MRPDRRSGCVLAVLAVAAWLAAVPAGLAALMGDTAAAQSNIASATLAPPSNLSAANGACVTATTATVDLSWTATTSGWAAGYEVGRATVSGGPYTVIATIDLPSTTTHIDVSASFSTTYYYVVRAMKGSWRSTYTTEQSVTTPSSLCNL